MADYLGYKEFENNSWNDDGTTTFGGTTYKAMTFTPGRAHDVHVIRVKLIRTGSCGTVTLGLYDTDSTGKPTGSALRTATVAQSGIETSATWIAFTLSSSYRLDTTKYAIVLSAAASGIGARYQTTGEYTAGSPWSSTNSGSTWTESADEDMLFKEYGTPVQLYGCTPVQLYPGADGTYKQLVPRTGNQGYIGTGTSFTAPSHFLCVSDLKDAPDEGVSTVSYSLHKWVWPQDILDEFMSGSDEGAAGYVSGTSGLFRCGVAGYWGLGTSFSTELAVDYLLRSPTPNYYWKDNGSLPRISQVSSIESDTSLTLTKAPVHGVTGDSLQNTFKNAWYITPNSSAEADATDVNTGIPMKSLSGEWVYTNGTAYVNGTTGDAINETSLGFDDVALCGPTILGQHGLDTGNHDRKKVLAVNSVVNDNQIKLDASYTGATHTMPSGTNYFTVLAFKDDLTSEDTATQWCTPTKKDSFLVKKTLNKGFIKEVAVVYRVATYGAPQKSGNATIYEHYTSTPDSTTTCSGDNYACLTFTPSETHDLVFCKLNLTYASWGARARIQLFATDGAGKPTGSALATAYGQPGASGYKQYTFNTYVRLTADTTYALVISSQPPLQYLTSFTVHYIASGGYSGGSMFLSTDAGSTWTEESGANIAFEEWGCKTATGTAQPFLYMNSTEVTGTEVTIEATGNGVTEQPTYVTYREILARPGGGVFTLDDLESLEVGIYLGNLSDPNLVDARVSCTQLYLDILFTTTPNTVDTTVGLTEHGMATYPWGMDDHGRPVFDNGIALFLLQEVYHSSIMNPYRILARMIPILKKTRNILRRKGAVGYTGGRKARSQ